MERGSQPSNDAWIRDRSVFARTVDAAMTQASVIVDASPRHRAVTHFTRDWDRKIASTSPPRIRFHDLRHAHATHLLASGVHPKIAGERLVIVRSGLRSTSMAMCCRICGPMLPPLLTMPYLRP